MKTSKTFLNLLIFTIQVFLGVCIGYYLIPKDYGSFDQGFLFGVKSYKNYLSRMGSFYIESDSTVIIISDNDSIRIYK